VGWIGHFALITAIKYLTALSVHMFVLLTQNNNKKEHKMILYNTLMGVSAGLALLLVTALARKLRRNQPIAPEGWALTLGILGVILTFLSGLMAVTWPLTVNPPINILFAEPNLVLGLLLLAATLFLWKQRQTITDLTNPSKQIAEQATLQVRRVLSPVSWIVGALGLMLVACTCAIFRFMLIGAAPQAEPISGLLHNHPAVENTFFGLLYGLCALGALLAPFALRKPSSKLPLVVGICWMTAGAFFLLFSVLNYYTHIGMLTNLLTGTDYKI
jgi:hypothetical protein